MFRKNLTALGVLTMAATLVLGAGTASADEELGGKPIPKPSAPAGISVNAVNEGYPGAQFAAMAPKRVLDTRNGTGRPGTAPVGPGQTINLSFVGQVPEFTDAVVLNLTGVRPSQGTFISAWPAGFDRPATSNLNMMPGEAARANAITVPVGADGSINLYNHLGDTHLVADLAGFYFVNTPETTVPSAARLSSTGTPIRVLDTRNANNPLWGGNELTVDFSQWVDPTATAVNFNLTAVSPTHAGFITAYPSGSPRPNASSLNTTPGRVTPNNVTVALGPDKKVKLYNNAGITHLVVDLGAFYTKNGGANFFPVLPGRLFDSRDYGQGAVRPGQEFSLGFTNSDTDAVWAMNVTGTDASADTFVSVWPAGQGRPNASVLNQATGQTAANFTLTTLAFTEGGKGFSVYNHYAYNNLIFDLFGYFA